MPTIIFGRDDKESHREGLDGDIGKRIVMGRDYQGVGNLIKGACVGLGIKKCNVFGKVEIEGHLLVGRQAFIGPDHGEVEVTSLQRAKSLEKKRESFPVEIMSDKEKLKDVRIEVEAFG